MSRLTTTSLGLAILVGLGACGDDLTLAPDAPVGSDVGVDAPVDAPAYVAPTPFAIPLSATGPDQLMVVAAGPGGTFYAAGFIADTLAGAKLVSVVRLTAAGALDTSFGTGGIATTTFEFTGGTDEIDLAVQADGKVVVSATVANLTDPADKDVLVLRLATDGTLDTTFGTLGSTRLDLSSAVNNAGTLTALDSARSLSLGPSDAIFVHAVQRGEGTATGGGPRTDTDFVIAKLAAGGLPDLTYGGGDGRFLLDIQESNATAKGMHALADGSVIGSGYANSPGVGSTQPVLYKLTPAGALDTAFAGGGVFHEVVLAAQTEIYSFAIHGATLVTAGYGRQSATPAINDWVSLAFDVTTGARDLTWGGTTNGAVVFDPSGAALGANCRNALALPGGRTLLLGSYGPANLPTQDAAFAVLDAAGQLDAAFGDGIHGYDLGQNDQLWGAAVSGGTALLVGWRGGLATPTATVNDDAFGLIVALP